MWYTHFWKCLVTEELKTQTNSSWVETDTKHSQLLLSYPCNAVHGHARWLHAASISLYSPSMPHHRPLCCPLPTSQCIRGKRKHYILPTILNQKLVNEILYSTFLLAVLALETLLLMAVCATVTPYFLPFSPLTSFKLNDLQLCVCQPFKFAVMPFSWHLFMNMYLNYLQNVSCGVYKALALEV